ncbi:MAG: DUF1592 domain-containing protein [Planctomycetota bacterium]
MYNPRTTLLFLLSAALAGLGGLAPAQDPAAAWGRVRPFLDRHCADCHDSGRRVRGGVDFAGLTDLEAAQGDPELLARAAELVGRGEMPPASRKDRPEAAAVEAFVRDLERIAAARSGPASPGRPTLRRLSPDEYARTIRDLLGVTFDAAERFPAEAATGGFDNLGDTLFASPTLVEKYFDATVEILDALDADEGLARKAYLPDLDDAAFVASFLRRAFRRPPTSGEIASRVALCAVRPEDPSPRAGRRAALQSALLSPHFLYRVERDAPAESEADSRPLDDHELAVRLSYFLTSTMPDSRLRDLADAGRLRDEAVLAAEVDRLLAAPRSRAFAENFAGQWIGFREIRRRAVDFRRYSGFDQTLKDLLFEEGVRFFQRLATEDLPLETILDADFAMLNERLAKHYGIAGVEGWPLRPVALTDRRRGGVLGMGAVLTLTSYPLRTSPVLRGRWILETLLDAPPPPPPPNAGTLPEDDVQKDGLTLRQRLEKHRADPACASCHARIDPLGFALEGFDGVGRAREEDQGRPVDDRATLPDGREIRGPAALKAALLERAGDFRRAAAKAMMTYALGRELGLADEAAVRDVLARTADAGGGYRALVRAVVTSETFRRRETTRPRAEEKR